jgi:secreted trypsin-like serine protease
MSKAVIVRIVLVASCLGFPVTTFAQGSARLMAAEKQWKEQQGVDQRIIGGKPVPLKDNPWQVAILAANVPSNLIAQFCGGSIVAPRWVLTAAHCVDSGTTPARIHILTGTESLEKGGTRVQATRIIVHESWAPKTSDNDLALIEVESDLGGQAILGDVSTSEHSSTLLVRVTGWGRTSKSTSAGSKVLQGAEMPYVTRQTCNEPKSYDQAITANMICVGLAKGGVDSCQGDSGGPASAVLGGTRRLVGIVSWGEGCAQQDKYGVYTNVSNFGAWVTKNTGGAVKW